ncbi:MAG: Major facilitator superfamily transporter [Candidatus Gottesmanbacteria bacterium GW2011_GWC2_39_8]|uniref:Major facilitator superfamily transporter n=1 Tax=Candidatus Gottesmanbacteria bacterium GW2011_GWC2_39_8 TaxID=1618450 RepID=A0A0G0PVD7_9BACT|nr:MAG: Major facilitator superfamily transporter [Candidatus Gottesmanbacteria bacterium GW2011_GWC2_39_8]
MPKNNRNVLIISLIVLVNMLGYGIIIPILYAYSKKYGLSDFANGLLFALYSVCQFFSTPIIGRLSDKYGRRPMLLLSLFGTALSFFVMAFAPNVLFLFIARALDGLTAGNIPVAFAVISDSTSMEERARAFGIVGASLSFGFVFGPGIAALTVGFGEAWPFIIAGIITLIAVILTAIYLPETNTGMKEIQKGKVFDFPRLWHTLFDKDVGTTFLISLIFFLAFSCAIIYGFQPYTSKVLKISPSMNAILFTIFGGVGLISQTFFVQRFAKAVGMKKAFATAILMTSFSFILMFFSYSLVFFVAAAVILALFNSVVQTLIPTILSQEADARSQGSIMGLNTSYQSLGMIAGPIFGGYIATIATPLPFIAGSFFALICYFLSFRILNTKFHRESAFS